jgi:hypothetical protein
MIKSPYLVEDTLAFAYLGNPFSEVAAKSCLSEADIFARDLFLAYSLLGECSAIATARRIATDFAGIDIP